jgi:hypothetical protein
MRKPETISKRSDGMTNQADIPEDRRWLLEPAGAGEVKLNIEFGPGTEVTQEVHDAAERLVQALFGDVAGFTAAGPLSVGEKLPCPANTYSPPPPPECGTNSCGTRSGLIGRLA